MRYRTPAALEMAVKAAAKASPLGTNLAISGFYFHRLLCRVFSEKDRKFALKRARALSNVCGQADVPRSQCGLESGRRDQHHRQGPTQIEIKQ